MVQYIKMKIIFPENLKKLSDKCPSLYLVGGYVRNFLIDESVSDDIDIAAPSSTEEIKKAAEECGFKVVAEYKRTGTAVIYDGQRKYEYTRFRTDSYLRGGKHVPEKAEFTDDIVADALRRDFKCNAVYYDIKRDETVDPLSGVKDIKNKVLDTVRSPEEVFCSDGLRLMRLARFKAELCFSPAENVLNAAKKYADNIRDISPERIFAELKKILVSDTKYPFSDKNGHYTGIKLLDETGVLDILFPEITAGRGMVQRSDFHKYDVLEHSLRTVLYAPSKVRLAALLHDCGKPYCKLRYGTFKGHAEEGEKIAREILGRLKADGKTTEDVAFYVRFHMADLKNAEKESDIRLFIAENRDRIPPLLALKQADFSACKDDLSVCKTVEKWTAIINEMQSDGTPETLKDLKISPQTLMEIGFRKKQVGEELKRLFKFAVTRPRVNDGEILRAKAEEDYKSICNDT